MARDEDMERDRPNDERTFSREIGSKEQRRLEARRHESRGMWFGLGMFGLVGWSVAVPTIVGIAIGAWADSTWPSRFSWTLTGLFVGVVVGCWNAWYWVKRESGRK